MLLILHATPFLFDSPEKDSVIAYAFCWAHAEALADRYDCKLIGRYRGTYDVDTRLPVDFERTLH